MITKTYILSTNFEVLMTLKFIENSIPCFTHSDFFDNTVDFITFTITCRIEDIVFVENTLAPLV